MEKVLLVGENPETFSGNGNMLAQCLSEINAERYKVCAFIKGETPLEIIDDIFEMNSFPTLDSDNKRGDSWGKERLLYTLQYFDIDQLIFIGLDLWRYAEIFPHIQQIQNRKGFEWKMLIPYDLDYIRNDWVYWMNMPDKVYIYSETGYNLVKDHVKNAEFFRPMLPYSDFFVPATKEDKDSVRKQLFPDISDNTTIFNFTGANQIRKNIPNILQGFSMAAKEREDIILYFHTNNINDVFGLERLSNDFDIPKGTLRHNSDSRKLLPHEMAVVYKGIDCHILPSLQEGLSWTVIETKKMGIPSILSYSTAHKDFSFIESVEYVENGDLPECNGIFYIKPKDTTIFPSFTAAGPGYIQAYSCSPEQIRDAIFQYLREKDSGNLEKHSENAIKTAEKWLSKCRNFSEILEDKIEKHSFAGGEVL